MNKNRFKQLTIFDEKNNTLYENSGRGFSSLRIHKIIKSLDFNKITDFYIFVDGKQVLQIPEEYQNIVLKQKSVRSDKIQNQLTNDIMDLGIYDEDKDYDDFEIAQIIKENGVADNQFYYEQFFLYGKELIDEVLKQLIIEYNFNFVLQMENYQSDKDKYDIDKIEKKFQSSFIQQKQKINETNDVSIKIFKGMIVDQNINYNKLARVFYKKKFKHSLQILKLVFLEMLFRYNNIVMLLLIITGLIFFLFGHNIFMFYSLQILFSLILQLIIRFFLILNVNKKIDKTQVQKYRLLNTIVQQSNNKQIKKKQVQQLQKGDVILIKKDQIIPCDMLLLTFHKKSKISNRCYIFNYSINEELLLQQKQSLQKLQPKDVLQSNDQEFKQYIQELSFDVNIQNYDNFSDDINGYLQIHKDPKKEMITQHNIIYQNSILRQKWAIGLVIKQPQNDQLILNKKSQIEKKFENYQRQYGLLLLFLIFSYYILITKLISSQKYMIYSPFYITILFNLPLFVNETFYIINFIYIQKIQNHSKQIELQKQTENYIQYRKSHKDVSKNKKVSVQVQDKNFLQNNQSQAMLKKRIYIKKQNPILFKNLDCVQNLATIGSLVLSKNQMVQQTTQIVKSISNQMCFNYISYSDEIPEKVVATTQSFKKSEDLSQNEFIKDRKISKPQIKILKPIQQKTSSLKNSIECIQINPLETKNEHTQQENNLLLVQNEKNSQHLSLNRQQTQNFFTESFLVLPQYRQSNNQIFHKKKIKLHKGLNNEFIISKIQTIQEFILNFLLILNLECLFIDDKNQYQSHDPTDNSIIEFLKLFNIKIKDLKFSRQSNSYNLYAKQNNLNYKFKIYYCKKDFDKNTYQIIVFDYQEQKINFFLRTTDEQISNKFTNNHDLNYKLEQITESNTEVFLKSLYIYQTQIDEDQSKLFMDFYSKKMKYQSQIQDFLIQKFKEHEKQLSFKFCLGLKEQINETNLQFFQKIFQAGIRLCLLTSDTEQFTKSLQQKLMVQGGVLIKFDFIDEEEGCLSFKDQFQKIEPTLQSIICSTHSVYQKVKLFQQKNRLIEHKRFVLLLSGQTLNIIFKNPYLYYNFKFFVAFSCQIYCYQITTEQKKILVEILQDLEKTKSLMVISQVKNEQSLVNMSDVSIQFQDIDIGIFADIYVNSLEVLEYLIFNLAQPLFFVSLKILDYFIYINSYYLVQFAFYYKIFQQSEFFIIQKNFIQMIIAMIFLIIKSYSFDLNLKKSNLLYYSQNEKFLQQGYKRYLIYILEGSSQSIITCIYGLIFFKYIKNFRQMYNNQTFYFGIQIINNIQILFRIQSLKYQKKYLFLIFLFFLIQTFLLFLNLHIYYKDIQLSILKDYITYIAIVVNMTTFLFYKKLFNIIQSKIKLRNFWKEQQKKNFNDEELQEDFFTQQNQTNPSNQLLIYKIYRLKQFIDPFLLGKLYPLSILEQKDTLSKMLLNFKNDFLKKTFIYLQILKNQQNRSKFLVQYLFLILLIIINQVMIKQKDNILEHVTVFLFYLYYYIYFKYFNLETKLYQKIKIFYYFSEFLVFINIFLGKNNFSLYHLAQIIFIQHIVEFEVLEFLLIQLIKIVIVLVFFLHRYTKQDLMTNLYSKNLLSYNLAYITIFTLLKLYYIRIKKQSMLLKFRLLRKKNQNNELLTFLMPQFILKKLSFNLEQTYLAEDAGIVSVLFLYICDFNDILNAYQDNIINLLDQIYKDFDILCQKHGVQKIETVGCSYVAACGGQIGEDFLKPQLKAKDPTKRIFELALSIMNIINNYKDHNGNKMRLKIGINKGKCLMGVIGYHKPQFSLIGDTINTTSRLCTTGKAGNIMVSESVYNIIKDYSCNKKIEFKKVETFMKGKGNQNVYHVFKKQKSLKKIVKQVINKQKDFLINSEGRGKRIKKRGKTIKEVTPLDLQKNNSFVNSEKKQIQNITEQRSNLKVSDEYKIFQKLESQKDLSYNSQLFQSSENNEEQNFLNFKIKEEDKRYQFEPINKISCYNNKIYNIFVKQYQEYLDKDKLYINYIINIFMLISEIFTFTILLIDGIQHQNNYYITFNCFRVIQVVWILLNLIFPFRLIKIQKQNILLIIFSISAFLNIILDFFVFKTKSTQAYYSNQFHKLMIYIIILIQQYFKKHYIVWLISRFWICVQFIICNINHYNTFPIWLAGKYKTFPQFISYISLCFWIL